METHKSKSTFTASRISRAIMLILVMLVMSMCQNPSKYTSSDISDEPGMTLIIKNHCNQAGFFSSISVVNHALYACERSNWKLVLLFDNGPYKEDRPGFIADNPCYNQYDWFSYYFEPINQTSKPISYWKKWCDEHPSASVVTPAELSTPSFELTTSTGTTKIFSLASVVDYYSFDSDPDHYAQEFHRIWHKYFKLRPHIQTIVDDFKRKHDFSNKYVITLHYRGTDKFNHYVYEDNHEHPPYEFCSNLIKEVIKKSGRPLSDIVTFVATDEQPFVEHMQRANVNAVFTDAMRSHTSTSGLDFHNLAQHDKDIVYRGLAAQSVHLGMQDKSNYIKGCDVLVDAILLGSGNVFIQSRGNVSRQARWIGGPTMECIDLVDRFNTYKKNGNNL